MTLTAAPEIVAISQDRTAQISTVSSVVTLTDTPEMSSSAAAVVPTGVLVVT
jgi:hypothetical protein